MNDTVVYCRTANGGAEVIERQLASLLQYGKSTGFTSLAAYCDCNESGVTLDRPGMRKLLNDIRACKVRRVIVNDISRLSRNIFRIHELIRIFQNYNVELISMNDGGLIDMNLV